MNENENTVVEAEEKIDQFLDDDGKITQLPRKQAPRLAVLTYLAGKFEMDKKYTEREVNEICTMWHTFDDYFVLRRELVDYKFLDRKPDCSQYWRVK